MESNKGDEQLRNEVKQCVITALDIGIGTDELDDDEVIIGGEVGLDSVATIRIVATLEEEFGIDVEPEDLTGGFFNSINSIVEYVQARRD